jgi:hypothetical protein
VLTTTSEQRPPVYNGQHDLQLCVVILRTSFSITTTFEQRPLFWVPRLAVVHIFDCLSKRKEKRNTKSDKKLSLLNSDSENYILKVVYNFLEIYSIVMEANINLIKQKPNQYLFRVELHLLFWEQKKNILQEKFGHGD